MARALVLDRYVLHTEIAAGGMASVWLGRAIGAAGFSRPVAIKRMHPHLAADPESAAMFQDEARLAARVRHPHVVPTLDVVSADDELLIVMEYVAGASFASAMRGGPVPPAVAASIAIGVLSGLHAAHEARGEDGRPLEIVHRDVSPQNIIVGEDGLARVLDFGVARAAVRSHATRDGTIKGKLRYLAPEQLRGAPATCRTDVYALAVVLWEALTGARLFDGDNEGVVYGRILEGVVRPPSAFAAVPPALDAVVLRGLERNAVARFPTAHAMAVALEQALPPASPREVSAWLHTVAGRPLAERARRVEEMERGDAPVSEGPISSSTPQVQTAGETASERAPQPWLARQRIDSLHDAPLPTSTVTAAPAPFPESPPTSTLTAASPPLAPRPGRASLVAVLVAAAIAVASLASMYAHPRVPSAYRGVGKAALLVSLRMAPLPEPTAAPAPPPPIAEPAPPARKAPPVAAHARSACDPPYYVDASGIRRVKRECL